MSSPAPRRVLAFVSALALGVAGTLIATPALAAPTVDPQPLTPAADSYLSTSRPHFTWTPAESDSPFFLRYNIQVLDDSGTVVRFVPLLLDAIFDDWRALLPLPDGDYSWQVRGVDRVGFDLTNPGPWSAPVPFTVDTVAPDVTLTAPASGLFGAAGVTVTGTVADENPGTVVLLDNGSVVATDSTGGSSFSFAYAPGTGVHTLEVVATDRAGNSDAGSRASVVVSIDADAPSLAILSPTHDSWVKIGAPLDFQATATDGNRFSWNGRLDGAGIPGAYGHLVTGPVTYQTTIDTAGWTHGSSHALLWTATDELGQKATLTSTVKADGTRPVVTFSTPAVSSQLNGVVTVSGTATDTGSGLDGFQLNVRTVNPATGNCGGVVGSGFAVPVASDGTWSLALDTSAYDDGDYCFTALATDRVGNDNGGGNHLKFVTFDNSAPAGTLSPVFPAGFTLTADRFEWTALSDPNGVTYEVALGDDDTVDADGLMTSGLQLLGSTGSTTLPYAHRTGPAYWQVRAVDDLGNATPWTAPTGFQVIGVPSVIYPTPGLQFSADSLTAQWTPSFGVGGVKRYEIEYGVDRDHDGVLSYETRTVPGHTAWPAGLQSRTQDFSAGYEGPLTIRVRAVYNTSFAGSQFGPWSDPAVSYLRDTAKPTIAIVAPAPDAVVKSDAPLPVTITGTDAAGISRLVANLYAADGSTFLGPIGSTPANGALGQSATRTWDIPAGLAEGDYVIRASATDAAGKTTATSQGFTVDRTRPTVTIDVPADGTVLNGDVTVTVTGTDPNGIASIVANLYNASNSNPLLRNIGHSSAPSGAGTHSATWVIPISWFTADGTYTIRAGGVDAAGNNRTVTARFTIDRTGPAAPQPINPENGRTQADDSPLLDWTDVSDAVSYEVRTSTSPARVPNVNDGELSGGDAVTVPVAGSELQLSGLPEGLLFWQVRGIDALGNVGPWSNIWALGVDTEGPVVTQVAPSDGAVLATGSFSLSWTGEAGATYELRTSTDPAVDVDGVLTSGGVTTGSTAAASFAGVPEDTYYWQVRGIDAVGNAGPWTPVWSFAVDLPTLALQGPAGAPGDAGTELVEPTDLTTFALDEEPTETPDQGGTDDGDEGQDPEPTAATAPQSDAGTIALIVGLVGALLLLLLLILAWLRRRNADA